MIFLEFQATSNGAFGQFALQGNVSIQQGLVMEIMLTAILVFIVLMAAVELSAVHAAFAIGFVILIDIMAGYAKLAKKAISITLKKL